MRQFNIYVRDQPGALASLVVLLAKSMVNLNAVTQERHASDAVIKIVTSDANTTRGALDRKKYSYSESEVLGVEIDNTAGELAKVTQRLADAHINIRSIYLMEKEMHKDSKIAFVFEVNDNDGARRILGDSIVSQEPAWSIGN